ncbi:MAG: peptidylprolyl isomerase [Anaerolineae bacterium]
MGLAKNGDLVKVHYTGKLNDGTVFDSSVGREPLEFTLGEGQVIPGFESAVEGMNTGENKTTQIPSEEAYGPHYPEMVLVVPRNQFPLDVDPKVGDQLQLRQPDGQSFVVNVTETTPEAVTLDANHPLAGKDLNFDIQLVEITSAGN